MVDFTTDAGKLVKQFLVEQYFVWFTTVDSKLTPQVRPVWFIWEDDSFLIYSMPQAYKLKHIEKHPNVALHFNSDRTADNDVVIFTGTAVILRDIVPAYKNPVYLQKYKAGIEALKATPEEFSAQYSVGIRVVPESLRSW